MKRVNLLPNVITAFGLACGLFVIFRVSMSMQPTYELLYHMTLILLLAGVADLLDGVIARAIKAESEFGLVFDSLADAISFGVAPSILLLKFLSLSGGGPLAFLALAGAMIYTVCGVLRLVRFNVRAALIKDDDAAKKTFIGLPIPAAAACAIAPNLFVHSSLFQEWAPIGQTAETILLSTFMIVVGYLMVSRIRFPSLKSIRLRIPTSFNLVFFATLMTCLVLYGLLYYLPILLMVMAWGYVVVSLTFASGRAIRAKNQARKSNSSLQ